MLQMVRTLAQFTIALEDMRDIGDGIDAAFATSGLSGAAEELPEKGCGSRGGTEVMAEGVPGMERGGGRWDAGVRWGCMDASCLDTCAEPGTCGVWTAIAVATVPPSSSSARHPRDSLDCGEGGCSRLGRVMGGLEPSLPPPPPGLIYTAEASAGGKYPNSHGGRG